MGGFRTIWAVLVRPTLWATAVVQLFRLAPTGWWRRPPFLPLPDAHFMEFRLATQYGGTPEEARARVKSSDVVDYLVWCRTWNREQA
jgi:hypothetical protein